MSQSNLDYSWPNDFPENIPECCEPTPANGKVYRLVRTVPPTAVDFQKHRDEHPDYVYVTKDKPLSYGVSFFTTISKLKRKTCNYPAPEQYEKWQMVGGELVPELGVIKEKSGHVTLWVQEGAYPHRFIKDKVNEE